MPTIVRLIKGMIGYYLAKASKSLANTSENVVYK